MIVDISGVNKAQLLIALFNNAKQSKLTATQISVAIRLAESLGSKNIDRKNVEAHVMDKILTEERANQYLSDNSFIRAIEDIAIHIDFSGNVIDTTQYDAIHGCSEGGKPDLVKNIISKLRWPHENAPVTTTFFSQYQRPLIAGAVVLTAAVIAATSSYVSNNKLSN